MTLGDAVRHDMKLRIVCAQCGRTVVRSGLGLAILQGLPFETRLHDMAKRLKCSRCGGREVDIANAS